MPTPILPEWFDEWVVVDEKGWSLKEDAPQKIKEEYDKIIKNFDMVI